MHPRKRRNRKILRRQNSFRDNDLKIELILEKTEQEVEKHEVIMAKERKKSEKLSDYAKNIDAYKKMAYNDIRKEAKSLGIDIYRKKKEELLKQILKKLKVEYEQTKDPH